MNVGVLELLAPGRAQGPLARLLHTLLVRQYASVMPQALAVWLRRAGHRVHYATFFGQTADPTRLLPDDLDVVLIACHSRASALAYALARLYRRRGVRTVCGGPHAEAFPDDTARFFDLVVGRCDEGLLPALLSADHPRGTRLDGAEPVELPTLRERAAEIRIAAFRGGRPYGLTTLPLLASRGCPYTCDFCVDWNKPYRAADGERLAADLRWAADALPGVKLGFHDPNFAVRFDETLDVLESIPRERRNPYVMQSSMSILRDARMRRLQETGCVYTAPSIESWNDYSDKAGVQRASGRAKLERLVPRFRELGRWVTGIQVNFVFGLDADRDGESYGLTREFVERLPQVLPTATIAMPYGGTPLYDRLRREGRVIEALPPAFYYAPHCATVLPAGGLDRLYDQLVGLFRLMTGARTLAARWRAPLRPGVRRLHTLRAFAARAMLRRLETMRRELREDRMLRAFHEGEPVPLPERYHAAYERMLGPFAELVPRNDRLPLHGPAEAAEPAHGA